VTEGIVFPHDELISLPSVLPLLRTLQKELSQPTMSKGTRMRLVIDKAPEVRDLPTSPMQWSWPTGLSSIVYTTAAWGGCEAAREPDNPHQL
jgi:hypothetical protein